METALPKVLVADDDEQVRRTMRIMLDAAGYSVLLAGDGQAALDLLAEHPDVRVAFIDLVMPDLEGLETIHAIRARFDGVKIVAMSGAFDGEFLPPARMLRADIALAKPISLRMMLSCLLAFEPAPALTSG